MSSDVTDETVPASSVGASSRYVDWEFAKTTGARLSPPGPKLTRGEVAAVVADLRAAAAYAREPVATTAQLSSPDDRPALVVDRATWVAANVETFAAVMDPVVATMDRGSGPAPLRAAEAALIRQAVQNARGNVAEAARALGISRATVYRKLGAPKGHGTAKI